MLIFGLANVWAYFFFPLNIVTFNDCTMLPAQLSSLPELLKHYLGEYIEYIVSSVPDVGEARLSLRQTTTERRGGQKYVCSCNTNREYNN